MATASGALWVVSSCDLMKENHCAAHFVQMGSEVLPNAKMGQACRKNAEDRRPGSCMLAAGADDGRIAGCAPSLHIGSKQAADAPYLTVQKTHIAYPVGRHAGQLRSFLCLNDPFVDSARNSRHNDYEESDLAAKNPCPCYRDH